MKKSILVSNITAYVTVPLAAAVTYTIYQSDLLTAYLPMPRPIDGLTWPYSLVFYGCWFGLFLLLLATIISSIQFFETLRFRWVTRRLRHEMTREEVSEILGEPTRIIDVEDSFEDPDRIYWFYENTNPPIELFFRKRQLIRWEIDLSYNIEESSEYEE